MDTKKIFSTTLLFVAIVFAVVGFKSLFGEVNTLVGVSGITAALSLLGSDYTINPIKSTLYFIFIEVLLGISSFLASTNAILGLVITFIVIFYILYEFTYNTKKSTYVAFALGYFFMLYTPVDFNQLPNRLLSLIFCGLAIMAMQMLANNNKIEKQSKASIKNSILLITEQITLILNSGSIEERIKLNTKADKIIKDFNTALYQRLDNDINLTTYLNRSLFINKFLENINIMLEDIRGNNINEEYTEYLNSINALLLNISEFINNDIDIENLISKLENFNSSHYHDKSKYYILYKLAYYVSLLKEDLLLSQDSLKKRISMEYSISDLAKSFDSLKYNLSKNSLKFTFAFRGALITSLGVFIVDFFNIPNGKWLVFSLLSVVQPYLESSRVKGKDRVIGTVIGLVLFEIVFSIVTDNTLRTLIILATGYISNYQTQYKYQMTCTTISSLGAASIGSNINEISFLRISLVLIGTLIALYSNKVIFPYSMVDITKKEIKKSLELNKKILSSLYDIGLARGKFNDDLKIIVTQNLIINRKIDFNNNTLLSKGVDDFLYNQRMFTHKLDFLINNSRGYLNTIHHDLNLFYNIDLLLNKDLTTTEIVNVLNETNDIYSKLILIDTFELKKNIIISNSIINNIS